jgi:membrane protease YdiL (CAAX protease family)
MNNQPVGASRIPKATWLGLFVALFGVLIARQIVYYIWPTLTFTAAVWKESLIWLCVIALLVIIRRGERLPLTSVGIGTSPWWKSILWGLAMTIVCGLVGFGIAHATHYGQADNPTVVAYLKLPVWLLVFIVFRAGVVEELFYRGYAIERLESLGLNRSWAVVIPLTIFGVAHWTGGWANILIALALGVILSVFYVWRRDLVANMIAHFLVDFIGNVH